MSLIKLIKTLQNIKFYKDESIKFLRTNIPQDPKIQENYSKWLEKDRFSAVAATVFLAEQYCNLENIPFTFERKKRTYITTLTGILADDLMDNNLEIPVKELFLLDSKNHNFSTNFWEQKLFYTLNEESSKLLPSSFPQKHSKLIEKFNHSQAQGRKLYTDISPEEIREITNNIGGYASLLSYKILFPEQEPISESFTPHYFPDKQITLIKDQIIFNFGIMTNKLDDLMDLDLDKASNLKSQATEGLITWNSIIPEINYLKNNFYEIYPKNKVDYFMFLFNPKIIRSILTLEKKIPSWIKKRI